MGQIPELLHESPITDTDVEIAVGAKGQFTPVVDKGLMVDFQYDFLRWISLVGRLRACPEARHHNSVARIIHKFS